MAALTTIAAIAAITASAVSVEHQLTAKAPAAPRLPDPAPIPDPIAPSAPLGSRKARVPATVASGRASTLLTGPEGLSTPAAAPGGKTLLGQ